VQITDKLNGSSQQESATVQASPFRFAVPCAATSVATVGGTCALQSTFNAVVPGVVAAGRRAVWELGDVRVLDGGPDDLAGTPSGNALFARQGVFVP
jgi:hypothetical protein